MAAQKGSAQKAAQKSQKKGSKLASLKSAIFGAAKKKGSAAEPARAASKGGAKADKPDMKAKDSKEAKKAKAVVAAPKKGAAATSKELAPSSKSAPASRVAARAPKATGKGRAGAAASLRPGFDATGEAVCREVACEGLATSAGYCRMHYIKNWKKIKRKEIILKEGKLNQYIEELVAKYPDKYIEAIRQDLANDKDFAKVIYDLDLDESVDDFDVEGESIDAVIGDIKRDFEDEGEGF